jgi:hypothetical protein
VQSVHTSYKGYVLIEILTNYMYSTKYLHMYPLCISITSPDKGHTSSTPRGQYFSIKLLGHTKDMLASFGDHLASRKNVHFWGCTPLLEDLVSVLIVISVAPTLVLKQM